MVDRQRFGDSRITRRKAILGSATLVGGGVAVAALPNDARASVAVDSLTVEDATFEAESVVPVVQADIGYEFAHPQVARLWIGLEVKGDVIASEQLMTGTTELRNSTTLSGRVTDSAAFSDADFTVARGESVTVDVPVTVSFEVRDSDGNALVSDSKSNTVSVEVVHPDDAEFAIVGGSVSVVDGS